MAITSRNLFQPEARRVLGGVRWQGRLNQVGPYLSIGFWIVFGSLCLTAVSGWGRIWMDDLRYGRPRTQHLTGLVGHNEGTGEPTHIVAMNLNRRVVVIELPGGDVSKAQTLQGPYLFGANEDLTPVGLRLHDMNGDEKNDLILAVKNEEIVYINTGDTFRVMTAEERQTLSKAP